MLCIAVVHVYYFIVFHSVIYNSYLSIMLMTIWVVSSFSIIIYNVTVDTIFITPGSYVCIEYTLRN